MSTDLDPRIAHVLERFVPEVESDPDATLRAASSRAADKRATHASRRRRIVVVALAGLALLVGGGALAATQFDVLPWFQSDSPTEATFSIDNAQRYHGPAPEVLVCPDAGGGEFTCSEGGFPPRGTRTYLFTDRIEGMPRVTRDLMLKGIDQAERQGQVPVAEAVRVRDEIQAAGDPFFEALSVLIRIRSFGGFQEAPGRPGFELVPPAGIPAWAACRAEDGAFACRNLANSRDVPVGTPVYMLRTSRDWTTQPRPEGAARPDVASLFRAVMGRDLEPAEDRLLFDFLTLGEAEGGGIGEGPVQVSPSR